MTTTSQQARVTVTEELDIAALPWLRAALEEAVSEAPGLLVVDLTACPLLDPQAVPVLVEASRALAGALVLRGANAQVARVVALVDPDGELRLEPV